MFSDLSINFSYVRSVRGRHRNLVSSIGIVNRLRSVLSGFRIRAEGRGIYGLENVLTRLYSMGAGVLLWG